MGVQDRDWYWKERARKEGNLGSPPVPPPGSRRTRPIPRAAPSVSNHWLASAPWAPAAVLVLLATVLFAQWRNEVAAGRVAERSRDSGQQVTRQVEAEKRRIADQQAARQAEFQRQESARIEALREQERSRQRAAISAAEEAARKQTAWEKFYQRSSKCRQAATVECANDFIRARRAFEAKYSEPWRFSGS